MDASHIGLILFVVIVFVIGYGSIVYLNLSKTRKDVDKARLVLQAAMDPGEQLIEVTQGNTKGPSLAAKMNLANTSQAGSVELYVGLTNRRLIMTPVKPAENSKSVQIIPREDINGIEVANSSKGRWALTAHTRNGDMVLYLVHPKWMEKAYELQRAFSGK